MVKSKAAKTVIYDPSSSHGSFSKLEASNERRSFMSSSLADMYSNTSSREPVNNEDSEDEEMDMKKMLKDIERLGSSTMTWKERKKLENKNIVALGGKPTKSHRMPLSVAKVMMKNKKKREQKKIEEEKLLGIFTRHGSESSQAKKRWPEDRVLKATEGHFSHGVLNVKHLFDSRPAAKVAEGSGKTKKKRKNKGRKKEKKGKKGKRKGR